MTILFICTLIYHRFFRFRHFKIKNATARKWLSGNQEKEELTTYQIEVKTKRTSEHLKFDELWIAGVRYKFKLLNKEKKNTTNSFSEKDTLIIETDRELGIHEQTSVPPKRLKEKNVLSYLIGNKRKYLSIKSFEEVNAPLSLG